MDEKYKELLQAIIDKQISLVGVAVVVRRAKAAGLEITDEGKVAGFSGGGGEAVKQLVGQFKDLSGEVAVDFARKAAEPILQKYPELKLPI